MKRYSAFTLSADNSAAVTAACTAMEAAIAHYPDEEAKTVRRMAKIGDKTDTFTREALAEANTFAGMLPRDLDLQQYARNIAARDTLLQQLIAIESLAAKVRAAATLLGVEIYSDGLVVYHSLKRRKEPSPREAAKRLSKCFQRKPRKKKAQAGAGEENAPAEKVPVSAGIPEQTVSEPQIRAQWVSAPAVFTMNPAPLGSLASLTAAAETVPLKTAASREPSAAPGARARNDQAARAAAPVSADDLRGGKEKLNAGSRPKPRIDTPIDRQNRRAKPSSRKKGRGGS